MIVLLVLVMITIVSCTTTDSSDREKLEALFKRELPIPEQIQSASFSGGLLKLNVNAAEPPNYIRSQRVQGISFSIGSQSNVNCYVQDITLPGSNISNILNRIRSAEQVNALLEPVAEVKVVDDKPIAMVATYYKTNDGRVGDFKMAHLMLQDHSVNCTHDEPGFRATFKDLMIAMASQTQEKLNHYKIYDKRVYTVATSGLNIGFISEYHAKSSDEIKQVSYQTLLIPSSESTIKTFDTQTINHLNSNGSISKNLSLGYLNEKPNYEMSFEELSTNRYQIQGFFGKERINRVVKTIKPAIPEEQQFKQNLKNNLSQFEVISYLPNFTPRDFLLSKVEMKPGLREGSMTTQDQKVEIFLDKNFELSKQIVVQGETTFVVTRVL